MSRSFSTRFIFLLLFSLTACLTASSPAGQFVTSVSDFSEGTFATVGGTHYTDTDAVKGQPSDIVGAGSAFAGILTPFNAHFEQDQLTGIGLGGSITMGFANPVTVTGTPQIGIFTAASFFDNDYPNGTATDPAMTNAMVEYGAERTAVVEVGSSPGNFVSLGRVIFDDPTNFYANASGPYQYPAPDPALPASFDQPYAGSSSDYDGLGFDAVLAKLNGSAGGTWVSIPSNLGLSSVQYVRLSDPLWRMPDGSLVEERASIYFPPPDEFIKPADLFIDGAVLIPEPGCCLLIALASIAVIRRQARR